MGRSTLNPARPSVREARSEDRAGDAGPLDDDFGDFDRFAWESGY